MSETAPLRSLLESRGITFELSAFVVAAAFDRASTQLAFALGDGTIRNFWSRCDHVAS